MKFDRLNSSIVLNAKEEPTIYMALCLIESLFRDIEDATGKELSRAEPGNEQLPTKLIWLGRQLLKIYEENGETMTRNRERLDKMMEKVRQQEKSLGDAAEAARVIGEVRAREVELERLLSEETRQKDRLQELNTRQQAAAAETENLKLTISERQRDLDEHAHDKDKLIEELAFLEHQYTQLRSEIGSYENDNVAPLRKECEELTRQRDSMQEDLKRLRQSRDEAVLSVARLGQQVTASRQTLEEKQKDLRQKQQDAEAAAAAADRLREQMDVETERLEALQREAADLEQAKLPLLQTLIQEQSRQNQKLADGITEKERRKEELQIETESLKRDDAELSAVLSELQQTHDELVASTETNNEAIQKLRENVEALRGKNDREKIRRYRQQLEEEQAQLTELSRSCEELEQSLTSAHVNTECKKAHLDELRQSKQTEDEASRHISELIRELAPYGDAALQHRVQTLQNQQRLLEESHESLEESVALMQSVLDLPPETLTSNPDGLSESLQQCGKALDKLQKALTRCANHINKIKLESVTEG